MLWGAYLLFTILVTIVIVLLLDEALDEKDQDGKGPEHKRERVAGARTLARRSGRPTR